MQNFILIFVLFTVLVGCDRASDTSKDKTYIYYTNKYTNKGADCDECKKIYMKLDCQLNHSDKCEWDIGERCRCKK